MLLCACLRRARTTEHGTVRFIGHTDFSTGVWAGLELDLPDGKNNGEVKGTQYFVCEDNHGLFARPEKLAALDEPARLVHFMASLARSGSGRVRLHGVVFTARVLRDAFVFSNVPPLPPAAVCC